MRKVNWWQVAQFLGLICLVLCPPVTARSDEALESATEKVESDEEKRVREFDKFEAEIKREIELREKSAGRGAEVLKVYRDELTAEYHKNESRLADLAPGEHMALDRARLEDRQKVIGLHLWELERLEPSINAKAISCDDLQEKVRNELTQLQRNRRGDDADNNLQQRCQDLYRKLSELERRRHINPGMMIRSTRHGFYEVRPEAKIIDHDETLQTDGSPRFDLGAIQELRRPLRRLLKLRWAGSSLRLDREHWDDLFAGKSLEEVAAEVRKEFKERNADVFQPSRHSSNMSRPNIVLLFQNLHTSAADTGHVGGSSASGGGQSWRQSFETNRVSARMTASQDSLDLEIKEIKSPERSLRVVSRNDERLRIILIGDRMLYLEQRANGRVRLLEVYEDEMLHASGDTFLDVYSKHPDFVEVSLLPLLEHLGFIVPETRFSPRVRRRVVELVRMVKADRVKTFLAILNDLDSASFEIRERAGRELEEQQDLYVDQVKKAFRNSDLPLEVRSRLKRVLHQYERGPRQLDDFIAGMKMLDDPRYLANLLVKLPEQDRPVVAERLESLTGERLGTDVDAWQTWLQRSKGDR